MYCLVVSSSANKQPNTEASYCGCKIWLRFPCGSQVDRYRSQAGDHSGITCKKKAVFDQLISITVAAICLLPTHNFVQIPRV